MASQQHPLIRFSGLGFRAEPVACCCGWQGLAADLKTPALPEPGEAMRYACPVCRVVLAEHGGLSDTEILRALDTIRAELAMEMADIRHDALAGGEVDDCRWTPCFDCGVCDQLGTQIQVGPTEAVLLPLPTVPSRVEA